MWLKWLPILKEFLVFLGLVAIEMMNFKYSNDLPKALNIEEFMNNCL